MILRTGNERALTLIEVMVAVIILTVGIVGIIQAYIKSLDVLQVSRDYLVEAPLAEGKMVELQQAEVENGGLSPQKQKGKFPSPYDHFNWELAINPSDIAGLNTVTLRCFNANASAIRDFVLVSYAKNK